ncbi:uncharacterized protein LTR77_009270 [Saxophila tyrrhenica]|uniref:DRBM domain-containing protein n=1 Tax=Saxophila tyrrhenica TaxID=1690608 RepID=A0AAV9P202_9PEZI|nr:hypothetical protein LTR77_009270 [Saxophila tyrrhenica]
MALPFILRATQSDTDGGENNGPSESEFEYLSRDGQEEAAQSLYFWYGRQLLYQYLAGNIAKDACVTMPVSRLDWSLTQAVATFPYSDILAKLQQNGLQNGLSSSALSEDDKFFECVVGLGSAALRNTDRSEWISNFLAEEGRAARAPPNSADRPSNGNDVRTAVDRDAYTDSSSGEDSNLPRYTMTLKEVGDAEGRQPCYSIRQLSLVPPDFEAVVQFRCSTYEGRASTKKKAKHLASRNACNGLNIFL